MIEELNLVMDKIQPVLNELASKLGVASEHLWRILIKQQYVEGVIALGFFILGIIVIRAVIKFDKKEGKDDFDCGVIFFGGFFAILAIILGFIGAVKHFINPEYQALVDIFNLLNPK